MALIDVGSRAPTFELPDQQGDVQRLADHVGRPVVLYFYPKDDTTGCTAEACAFRDSLPHFQTAGAVVFGVSPDSVASHRAFIDKYKLTFPLLSDEPAQGDSPEVCQAYGVWQEKSMYGRTYMGVVRTTYLIDPQGLVARRWDKVSVEGHAQDVLTSLQALAQGQPLPPQDAPAAKKPAPKKAAAKKAASKPAPASKPAAKASAKPSKKTAKKPTAKPAAKKASKKATKKATPKSTPKSTKKTTKKSARR